MHIAHAVSTPIVAVFGPSEPARYAPRGVRDSIVRVDLPCSPCNRIRQPPERCTGHTPDCLAGVETFQVMSAIDETLRGAGR
jgi:ADP-heptose:LPS heptosyltransferase